MFITSAIRHLKSPSERTRRKAIEKLGASTNPKIPGTILLAVTEAAHRLPSPPDETELQCFEIFCDAATQALVAQGRNAIKTLVSALDEGGATRTVAARTLGQIGDESCIRALIESLGKDFPAHSPVTDTLVEVGAAVVPVAIAALNKYNKDRSGPGEGLVNLLWKMAPSEATEALIAYLKTRHNSIRWAAAHALGAIGEKRAVPALIQLLSDYDVGWAAAKALGKLGDIRALDPLLEVNIAKLRPQDKAKALAGLGSPAVSRLIEMLDHSDRNVRDLVASALGMIGDPIASLPLQSSIRGRGYNSYMVRALGQIGDSSAADLLRELLEAWEKEPKSEPGPFDGGVAGVLMAQYGSRRDVLCEALAALGDVKTVPVLIRILTSPFLSPAVLKALQHLLQRLPTQVAKSSLLEAALLEDRTLTSYDHGDGVFKPMQETYDFSEVRSLARAELQRRDFSSSDSGTPEV